MKASDLGYEEWYPGQWECIEHALSMRPGDVFIVEGPTAFGKSAIPAATAYQGNKTTVLVSTKELQQQYPNSFSFGKPVWGKNGYWCNLPSFIADYKAQYGSVPNVEQCASTLDLRCPGCPYWAAVSAAQAATFRILNYHYAWFSQWWRESKYVFMDEAHLVANTLRSLVRITMKDWRRKRWQLPPFPQAVGTHQSALVQVSQWLLSSAQVVDRLVLDREYEPTELAAMTRWSDRAKWLAESIKEGDWYINSHPGEIMIRPINIVPYARKLMPEGTRLVLMSATIGDPDTFAETLGIEKYEFLSVPHPIPPEQRPVWYVKGSPGVSYASKVESWGKQVRIIDQIMARHPNVSGLVLTASWRHSAALAALVRATDRVYLPSRQDTRLEQVRPILAANPGKVTFGPSFWEGLNLVGDLCRFIIIAKVPFLSMADPVVKILMSRPGGRKWYQREAAIKIAQGAGRAVRGIDDYAETYIIDRNWKRIQKLAPAWFKPVDVEEL